MTWGLGEAVALVRLPKYGLNQKNLLYENLDDTYFHAGSGARAP